MRTPLVLTDGCKIVRVEQMAVKRSRRFVMTAARPALDDDSLDGIDPGRWGLPIEEVQSLCRLLFYFCVLFHDCFTTRTRDTSPLAHVYLNVRLLLPHERNYANIPR